MREVGEGKGWLSASTLLNAMYYSHKMPLRAFLRTGQYIKH